MAQHQRSGRRRPQQSKVTYPQPHQVTLQKRVESPRAHKKPMPPTAILPKPRQLDPFESYLAEHGVLDDDLTFKVAKDYAELMTRSRTHAVDRSTLSVIAENRIRRDLLTTGEPVLSRQHDRAVFRGVYLASTAIAQGLISPPVPTPKDMPNLNQNFNRQSA